MKAIKRMSPLLLNLLLSAAVIAAPVGAKPVTPSIINNDSLADEADGANWASYGRTFSENHYSPLKEINADNVGRLGLAWFQDLDPVANAFTAPLAVDGVLYFAWGYSVVHAMDAQTGKLLWKHDPKAP